MFEQQHPELATAIDEMAERIRALGLPAPGSCKAYAELTSIDEGTGVPTADLPTQPMQVHEKDGGMLQSMLVRWYLSFRYTWYT
jgi:DNA-binding ferritin-like protein